MKILIATPHRNIVGGAETYVQALLPALAARGHQLAVLCDHPPDGHPDTTIDARCPGLQFWYSTGMRGGGREFDRLVDWKPDVVYSQGLESPDIERRLQRHFPSVLYAHAYYGACTTGRKCHAFPVIETCTRKFGPPACCCTTRGAAVA